MTTAPRTYLFVPGDRPDRFDKAAIKGRNPPAVGFQIEPQGLDRGTSGDDIINNDYAQSADSCQFSGIFTNGRATRSGNKSIGVPFSRVTITV